MTIDLKGKTAVVTGATGQLGRVMVRSLASCGANVAICYHKNEEMAQQLTEEVASFGCSSVAVHMDVTEFDSIQAARRGIMKTLPAPDILVNNAVIQYAWKSVLEQDVADFESQFDSCVMHNVYMAKAFVPDMKEKKYGRIIAINTECSMQMFESQSAYAAGKRGMDGLLRVLAREVGPHNITVNQVAPGWTRSDGWRNVKDTELRDKQDAAYAQSVPLRRRGEDQDIANAVCFLASDLAGFITGAWLPVCGGNVMPCI